MGRGGSEGASWGLSNLGKEAGGRGYMRLAENKSDTKDAPRAGAASQEEPSPAPQVVALETGFVGPDRVSPAPNP